jgi:hypothetical protein
MTQQLIADKPAPTAAAEEARSSATVAAELARTEGELERRSNQERDRRNMKLSRAEADLRSLLVAREHGASAPEETIAAAQRAVADVQLEIQGNEAEVHRLALRRKDLEREHLEAQGEEMLQDEHTAAVGLSNARVRLLETLVAAWSARQDERGSEIQRFEVRKRGDALADAGVPNVRRGVFVFDGAYRPHVDRLGDEIQKLCNELQVNIIDGKVVARER